MLTSLDNRGKLTILSLPVFIIGFIFTSGSFEVEEYVEPIIVPAPAVVEEVIPEEPPEPLKPLRIEVPEEVRAIYWTTGTTASDSLSQASLDFIVDSDLNAVVIDLKTDYGWVAFTPNNSDLLSYALDNPSIKDLDARLEQIGAAGVYRIARIAVFRDGAAGEINPGLALQASYGVWQDNIGSKWVDPASETIWQYNAALAREAYDRGFDEVQFDYVRFPSDGTLGAIIYPIWDQSAETRVEVMQRFFKFLDSDVRSYGIPVSVDLFGMTFWSSNDYGIGQRMIDAYPYVDYVSPMVYPSHYPSGHQGYNNPAEYPYEVVDRTLEKGIELLVNELGLNPEEDLAGKFRPWLQDFDLGAVYDTAKIHAQVDACRDNKASGWMMWNARNVYEGGAYYGIE